MKVVWFIISLVIVLVTSEQLSDNKNETEKFLFDGIVKTVKQCMRQTEKMDCFKRKTIEKLNQELSNNETVEITDMISIKKDPNWLAANKNNRESRSLENTKGEELDTMLNNKIDEYIKSIFIQFSFNSDKSEGRKKDKGGSMLTYGALGMASMLSQLFMGKVAMVSGMALLMSKIAMMLAIMSGFKKSDGGEHVVYQDSHGGGGWKRTSPYYTNGYARKINVPSQLDTPYYQDGKNQLN